MSKHTPGPWVTDDTLPGNVYSSDATGSIIATVTGFEWARRGKTVEKANARLIAAAPDMLEALKAINVCLSPGNRTFDEMIRDCGLACDVARTAIAKATGEA